MLEEITELRYPVQGSTRERDSLNSRAINGDKRFIQHTQTQSNVTSKDTTTSAKLNGWEVEWRGGW